LRELVLIACGFDAGASSLGRMLLPLLHFGAMTERLLDVTRRLCGGRLKSPRTRQLLGGRAVLRPLGDQALSGLWASIDDPFAYLADIGPGALAASTRRGRRCRGARCRVPR
jgi:hypothetical protein